jgi:hypothetical protein
MIALTQMDRPPLHIAFGKQGIDIVTRRVGDMLAELETYREMGEATDYPS